MREQKYNIFIEEHRLEVKANCVDDAKRLHDIREGLIFPDNPAA